MVIKMTSFDCCIIITIIIFDVKTVVVNIIIKIKS